MSEIAAVNAEQVQETRRRYCLQAMGVDLYLPRAELVNAKAIALPEPIVVGGKSKALGGTTSITESGAKPTRKSPAQDLDLQPQRKTRQNALQTTSVPPAEALRLQLRAWRAANDLLVIDSRDGDIALPTETLLCNMLLALGYPPPDVSKGENLRWPITERGSINARDPERDSADASAMVQAFIEAQQQRYQLQTLLLLGENAMRFALNPAQRQDKALWQTLTGPGDTRAIVLPSLAELLQQPALKKPTWHAIKPLQRERKHA